MAHPPDGVIVGVIRSADQAELAVDGPGVALDGVLVPLGDQVVVAPDARMDGVLDKLQDGEANRVLVVEDGEVVGIITPSDLARWLRRWQSLDASAR
jgi:CBS domain-containing protein